MIPVPLWLFLIILVIGGIAWIYDLAVTGPRRRREQAARKQALFSPPSNPEATKEPGI